MNQNYIYNYECNERIHNENCDDIYMIDDEFFLTGEIKIT